MTVIDAAAAIIRHPVSALVGRWNWKAALLSAALRGSIFFATTLGSGVAVASHVLLLDALFRVPLAGVYAAIVQALRLAEPLWIVAVVVTGVLPLVSHVIEFTVHRSVGTPRLDTAIAISITLSAVSSAFELLAMRRGLFIVGPGAGSLGADLARLPRLICRSRAQ